MKNLSLWIPNSNTSQLSTKLSLKAYQWNQFVLVLLKCNIFRYYHLWENARERLSQWCKDGKLQVRELTGDLKPLWEFVMEEKQSDIFNQSLSLSLLPLVPDPVTQEQLKSQKSGQSTREECNEFLVRAETAESRQQPVQYRAVQCSGRASYY